MLMGFDLNTARRQIPPGFVHSSLGFVLSGLRFQPPLIGRAQPGAQAGLSAPAARADPCAAPARPWPCPCLPRRSPGARARAGMPRTRIGPECLCANPGCENNAAGDQAIKVPGQDDQWVHAKAFKQACRIWAGIDK